MASSTVCGAPVKRGTMGAAMDAVKRVDRAFDKPWRCGDRLNMFRVGHSLPEAVVRLQARAGNTPWHLHADIVLNNPRKYDRCTAALAHLSWHAENIGEFCNTLTGQIGGALCAALLARRKKQPNGVLGCALFAAGYAAAFGIGLVFRVVAEAPLVSVAMGAYTISALTGAAAVFSARCMHAWKNNTAPAAGHAHRFERCDNAAVHRTGLKDRRSKGWDLPQRSYSQGLQHALAASGARNHAHTCDVEQPLLGAVHRSDSLDDSVQETHPCVHWADRLGRDVFLGADSWVGRAAAHPLRHTDWAGHTLGMRMGMVVNTGLMLAFAMKTGLPPYLTFSSIGVGIHLLRAAIRCILQGSSGRSAAW